MVARPWREGITGRHGQTFPPDGVERAPVDAILRRALVEDLARGRNGLSLRLEFAAAFHGAGHGDFVGVLDVAADGGAGGYTRDPDGQAARIGRSVRVFLGCSFQVARDKARILSRPRASCQKPTYRHKSR